MSLGSSGHGRLASTAHLPTSARFRARAPGPVSGQLYKAARRRSRAHWPCFPLPFGHRHSLLGHPVPPGASAPLTVGLPRCQHRPARTRTGFPRSARVRPGWVGRPLYPGSDGAHTAGSHARPPPAASQRPAPATPAPHTVPGCFCNEASTRIHSRSPFQPSPHLWPPDGAAALGLSPELHTPGHQIPRRMSGRGQITGTDQGYVSGIGRTSFTQPLTTCDLASQPLPKSGTGRQVDQNSETNLLRIIRLPLVCTGAWRV